MDKAEHILTNYNELKSDLEMLKYRLEHFKPVTENEVIGFLYIDEKAIFSVDLPVPDGSCRKIRYYEPEEVFITTKNYIELCPPDTCPPLNTSIFKKNNKRHVDDPDDF